MSIKALYIYLFSFLLLFSCQNTPKTPGGQGQTDMPRQPVSGSVAEEIRNLTETGILSSMLQAMETIRSRNLTGVDFGRMMNGINTLLIKLVYPDSLARLPVLDLPQTYNYTRIIRETERGNYVRPSENSTDFFEHILPFLAAANNTSAALPGGITAQDIFRDLDKASDICPYSILPSFFRGMLHERLNQFSEAERFYRRALSISSECYPAQIGIARVRRLTGNAADAVASFSDLTVRYPDSTEIKRELAISHFENRDWTRALTAIDDILRTESRDGELLLMKAAIQTDQGNFSQANTTLDSYASINPNNRMYLILRARVQAEGNRNRDSALNYLRSILRANPNDEEALVYAVTLLMESTRSADITESRELLDRLRRIAGSSVNVLSLSLKDAIARERWQEAQGFLNRVLAVRRTPQDLIDGYTVERNLGNNARALSYAREVYERETSNNDYAVIYISALIDNNRRDEASRLIESRINSVGKGSLMSRFYFLRSRLQTDEEARLGDLRSSLFEDPRNLDALIAMFEIYHRRREERRAVHYLRQALAIAPEHPVLKRYEREYAALLGGR
ncbi:MAG: tetratricopeptide repeat protein [Treponema sp.]|nr:tetratricopeptide repeat protein [Treponema sp.]